MKPSKSTIISVGKGFWKEERKVSGKKLDLFRGQNIPHNSKTIDRTEGIAAVISHKSTDLRRKSYSRPKSIYRLGMKFVNQLRKYNGEVSRNLQIGATYHLYWAIENEDCPRILEWFIPADNIKMDQAKMIDRVIIEAENLGVSVKIFLIPD